MVGWVCFILEIMIPLNYCCMLNVVCRVEKKFAAYSRLKMATRKAEGRRKARARRSFLAQQAK